jgi:hypothetical protein
VHRPSPASRSSKSRAARRAARRRAGGVHDQLVVALAARRAVGEPSAPAPGPGRAARRPATSQHRTPARRPRTSCRCS